ncbi:MAG TPA: multiubiquitin domain-containing protein [Candidatus Sulfotelmatobacter sp.]|nr:multiubiquitin domain-containing protein [Candidatus Sulfotelmatobacter sp.]
MHHTTIQIEINGHRHDVHHASRTGAEIKALVDEENGELFRLDGDERQRVDDDEIVHLHEQERFVIVHHPHHVSIRIEVDGDPYVSHREVRTGAEIKALAHRPPGNLLYRLLHDGQRVKIGDEERVHLKEGERFITVPPVGHAS